MLKAFKYRIYPTTSQIVLINKHIGASRFIFNLALQTKQMAWISNNFNLSCFDLIKQLPELKKECDWLKELNSQSLQTPIRHLDNAFTKFFKGQCDFPVFKKKSKNGSFNIPQNVILKQNKLFIPKFKNGIKIILHRSIKGEIRQATISKTLTNKFFVSILCETGEVSKPKSIVNAETTIGIDLGIKNFIVCSNNKIFNNPTFLRKNKNKLQYLQKKYSKHKSKRVKQKLSILHEKITNQRKDFLHKISSKLINNHDTICVENLAISNMLKNHNLAQAISDAGWGIFVNMLEYKAEWYGKNIIKIGRFDPSSKTCSNCGFVNKELSLKDREWVCVKCNFNHDRDLNAAINIKNFALKNHLSVERRLKNQDKLPTLVGAFKS